MSNFLIFIQMYHPLFVLLVLGHYGSLITLPASSEVTFKSEAHMNQNGLVAAKMVGAFATIWKV